MDLEVQNTEKEDQERLKELAAGKLRLRKDTIQSIQKQLRIHIYVAASSYLHIRIRVVRIRINYSIVVICTPVRLEREYAHTKRWVGDQETYSGSV